MVCDLSMLVEHGGFFVPGDLLEDSHLTGDGARAMNVLIQSDILCGQNRDIRNVS